MKIGNVEIDENGHIENADEIEWTGDKDYDPDIEELNYEINEAN